MASRASHATIDDYIAAHPADVQARLQQVRQTIQAAAPEATEAISYQIPTFKLHGNLIHFAAFQHHIGLYPGTAAIGAFQVDLQGYRTSKGTIQLPLDRALPLDLIERIVRFRVDVALRQARADRRS